MCIFDSQLRITLKAIPSSKYLFWFHNLQLDNNYLKLRFTWVGTWASVRDVSPRQRTALASPTVAILSVLFFMPVPRSLQMWHTIAQTPTFWPFSFSSLEPKENMHDRSLTLAPVLPIRSSVLSLPTWLSLSSRVEAISDSILTALRFDSHNTRVRLKFS